ncbi:tetratricopeptide repeat protein [Tanticharoenia sakaeratensis]|nr:tetratricopeptide repeat protein [Tanticharoenia sakaeratensis]
MIVSAATRSFSFVRRSRTSLLGRKPLPDAIETIRQNAMKGHVLAQVQWGDILPDSIYIARDVVRARQWFFIAANAGYGPAYNMIGRCYHFGWGCPIDLTKAAVSYRRAGELGDPWGQYNLGILLMRGLGIDADLSRALALFRAAASVGHAKSMNLVARFTEKGWETSRDPVIALDWYRRSDEGGDYRGQHNYATALLDQGQKEEALQWWRRAVPHATSDILLAAERHLALLGLEGDAAILDCVRSRLSDISAVPNPASKAGTSFRATLSDQISPSDRMSL